MTPLGVGPTPGAQPGPQGPQAPGAIPEIPPNPRTVGLKGGERAWPSCRNESQRAQWSTAPGELLWPLLGQAALPRRAPSATAASRTLTWSDRCLCLNVPGASPRSSPPFCRPRPPIPLHLCVPSPSPLSPSTPMLPLDPLRPPTLSGLAHQPVGFLSCVSPACLVFTSRLFRPSPQDL